MYSRPPRSRSRSRERYYRDRSPPRPRSPSPRRRSPSPRRRSPSPRRRTPEAQKDGEGRKRRRARKWDVDSSGQEVAPPANTAAGAAGSALPNAMARMQETAMMTALLQQQAALTRRARRLHIGNLPPGLTLESMRELFNTTLSAAKLTLDEAPCINDVHMSGDASFGFVEFRSVLECTNALVLDGMQLLGRALKVQRPNDYMPPPPGLDKVLIPQPKGMGGGGLRLGDGLSSVV